MWLQVPIQCELPADLRPLVAPKGSIAVDGVSLTVGEIAARTFSAYLVPLTVERTTAQYYAPGTAVNLEADCLARYVAQVIAARQEHR